MGTSTQYVQTTTSNIPEYAKPYYTNLMERAQAGLTRDYVPYQTAEGKPIERIAGFTPQQQAVQQNVAGLQTPGQFGTATGLVSDVAQRSIAAGQYAPGQFTADQVKARTYTSPQMRAAQTGFRPDLQYFQMAAPERFGGQQAVEYMSPFIQQALEPQMREAVYSAKRGQLAQDLGAARQGTYGGSRQLLAALERERNLGQQLGDIQARGMQSAYESAQTQFERDRAAQQAAQQANLQAALGVQQLGTQTGMQVALANLDAESQSRVQNLAAQLQTQGLNADQALRAALANQQYNLEAQRLGEQSRQFGAQQGLAALAQAGQMGQTLGNLGQYQQQADLARLGMQQQTAAQQQALQQQRLDQQYQDFLNQRDYYNQQLQQYSSLLHGVPVATNTTTTTSAPSPSVASQILGTGLGALGMYKTLGG